MKELSLDTSQQQEVLDLLLEAHRLRPEKAHRAPEILKFLFSKQGNGGVQAKAIAREVYGRAQDVEAVRRAVHALKVLLEQHYGEGEGKLRDIKIQIKQGPGYRLIFSANDPPDGDVVKKLWHPHLVDGSATRIVFAEPTFFRNADRFYLRNLDCNEPDDRWMFWSLLEKDETEKLIVSYHYLPAGELLAVLNVMAEFQRRGVFLDFGTTKTYPAWSLLSDENVILVGSSRSNPHIAKLQQGHPITVTKDGVQTTRPDGTSKKYTDGIEALPLIERDSRKVEIARLAYLHWEEHGESEEQNWHWAEREYDRRLLDAIPAAQFTKYVVVTRRSSTSGRVITMIAANHGRAAQGVAKYLTEPESVKILLRDFMKVGVAEELAAHFQILFEVQMTKEKGDVEAQGIEAIEFRTLDVQRKGPSPERPGGSDGDVEEVAEGATTAGD